GACGAARALRSIARLARAGFLDRSGRRSRRNDGTASRGTLRRLPQGLQARRTRAVDPAARPFPDAGRSRGLARADLCPADEAVGATPPSRTAPSDDGAPLRGLYDACRETVLSRAYHPARPPDRAERCPR